MKLDKRVFEPRLTLREVVDYADMTLPNVYYHANKGNFDTFVQHGVKYVLLSEIAAFLAKTKNNL